MEATKDRSFLTRRALLVAGGAGVMAAAPLGRIIGRWFTGGDEIFLTANDDLDGKHHLCATDATGRKLFSLDVEARCHQIAVDPATRARAIVFARRPGTIAYDVDVQAGAIRRTIRSAADRHFFGHGVFSPDGSVLFTTENDIPRDQGVVAVRDGKDLHVLAEIRTQGVGPHEMCVLADGRTLVVANGGLSTDIADDSGRRRDLNVPDMDPSLVYLDSHDGRLMAMVRPDDHFASIRHLSVAADGVVGVAMQYAGPESNPYPVVGFHRGDDRIHLVSAPRQTLVRMKRYCASICIAPSGVAAATCPRGDVVAFFDVASGELVKELSIRDAGGVAASLDGRRFVITTGLGEIHAIDSTRLAPLSEPLRANATRFDNHVVGMHAI